MNRFIHHAMIVGCTLTAIAAQANDYQRQPWWPSEFGADDQRGALNRVGPTQVLNAARLITRGEVFDLGRVFEEDMPLFELTPQPRKYTLNVPGGPTWGPLGQNALAWNEDFISGHLTQDGTQFDSLAHMATVTKDKSDLASIRYYNGFKHSDIATGRGFSKLGVEHVDPIFTRGILIDIAGLKDRMIDCEEEVSVTDLKAALERQGLNEQSIKPGDALFYNTGWGRLWKVDNKRFNSCAPGLTVDAGRWVAEKKVVLVGTDNWAVESIPGPDKNNFAPNHQLFLVEKGIYIIENMNFDQLIEAGVYEFAFAFGAIPFKGATGSPARPFAIR